MFREQIDFHSVIVDLEQCGAHHARIAHALGVSRGAVLSWKNSAVEPAYARGERLLALWCALMGSQPENVPRVQSRPRGSAPAPTQEAA